MTHKKTSAMEILRLLPKSNCKECGFSTCLAFATLVASGKKSLRQCPYLGEETIDVFGGDLIKNSETGDEEDSIFEEILEKFNRLDFEETAQRIGATIHGDRLGISCLGKTFELDMQGNLHSGCHVNSWVHGPLLNYAVHCAGRDVTDEWVPFGQLEQAKDWARFFAHRCEQGMKQIIDEDPEFFFDALSIFSPSPVGQKAGSAFSNADHSILVHPMPKVPIMIAYWRADEEFESKLILFFDRSAEINLGAGSIYALVRGIVEMFARIFSSHKIGMQ